MENYRSLPLFLIETKAVIGKIVAVIHHPTIDKAVKNQALSPIDSGIFQAALENTETPTKANTVLSINDKIHIKTTSLASKSPRECFI